MSKPNKNTKTELVATNYLEDILISSYIKTKEYINYHISLKSITNRRNFYTEIIPVLEDFVIKFNRSSNTNQIDKIIKNIDKTKTSKYLGDIKFYAMQIHPKGFELMNLKETFDLESLKTAYRKTAKIIHPDKGGLHDNMIIVNEAFSLFHDLLCQQQPHNQEEEKIHSGEINAPIKNGTDYLFYIVELLLKLNTDDYSLDEAYRWAVMLDSKELENSGYGNNIITQRRLGGSYTRLAKLFWTASFKQKSKKLLLIHYGARNKKQIEIEIESYKKSRFVINHERAAQNAIKYGIINNDQFEKTIVRLKNKNDEDALFKKAIDNFSKEIGFAQNLPTDILATQNELGSELIPEPSYYNDRIENLSKSQQSEYMMAFGNPSKSDLFQKYSKVRQCSLVRSMIIKFNDDFLNTVCNECNELGKILNRFEEDIFKLIFNTAKILQSQDILQRQELLNTLCELDKIAIKNKPHNYSKTVSFTINFTNSGIIFPPNLQIFQASATLEYLNIMQMPLERLKLALKTGWLTTPEERAMGARVRNGKITY